MIPLSTSMRPSKLEDFKGQRKFLYPGSLLYNSIKNGNFEAAIFYGPPGTGKTTLARIIANEMNAVFKELNATVDGTKEGLSPPSGSRPHLSLYVPASRRNSPILPRDCGP